MKNILAILLLVSLLGCSKEDSIGESELFIEQISQNSTDKYIYDTFTEPYNMVITYRWAGNEVDFSKVLMPPKIEKVQPLCELINEIWIKPYVDLAGPVFVKKYIPKQLLFVGTPNFNSDGTVTEGQAEGGRKITIFAVNSFDIKNKELLKKQFGTLHHEFGHILHQTKMFTPAFSQITKGLYTSKWYDNKYQEALDLGFVSAYAMESPAEDFVETIAFMLVNSNDDWNIKINASTPEGLKRLKEKEAIVVEYFQIKWNIDIYKLQKIISNKINKL